MPRYSERQIERALREANGLKSIAAASLGCTLTTILKRISESPHLQQVLEETRDSLIDFAESRLTDKMREGDMGALKFFLASQAKQRGYGNNLDITSGGQPLAPLTVHVHEVTDGDG